MLTYCVKFDHALYSINYSNYPVHACMHVQQCAVRAKVVQWRVQDFLKGFLLYGCAQNFRSHTHFEWILPFRSFWAKLPAQLICFQTTSLLIRAQVSHSSSFLKSVAREGVPFTENHSHSIKRPYFKSAKRKFPWKLWNPVWIRCCSM